MRLSHSFRLRSAKRGVKILNCSVEYKLVCTISTSDTSRKTFAENFFESIHQFDMVDRLICTINVLCLAFSTIRIKTTRQKIRPWRLECDFSILGCSTFIG